MNALLPLDPAALGRRLEAAVPLAAAPLAAMPPPQHAAASPHMRTPRASLLRLARDGEAQDAVAKVERRDAVRGSCRVEVVPLVDLVERDDEERRPRAGRRGEERVACRRPRRRRPPDQRRRLALW